MTLPRDAPNPADELVGVVDTNNVIVGRELRRRVRAENLRHRATYIFVFDRHDQIVVQKRTDTKDLFPGFYDAASGGVVNYGETYHENARRELTEELGITSAIIRPCFEFLFEDEHTRNFGKVYVCRYDGPFQLQAEEVSGIEFAESDGLLEGDLNPVTPDSLLALSILSDHLRRTPLTELLPGP